MKPNCAAMLVTLLLASTTSWACFAPPGTKPSSRLSELRLPQKPLEPAVVHAVKTYAFYLKPQDLLPLLQQEHQSISKTRDLLNSLQAKLPL